MNIFSKLGQKLKIKKSSFVFQNKTKKLLTAFLGLSSIAIASGSIYSITQKATTGGDYANGYLGRVEFSLDPNLQQTDATKPTYQLPTRIIEGKQYNFNDQEVLNKAIKADADALNAANQAKGYKNFFVNYSDYNGVKDNDATRLINLFFLAESFAKIKNPNPNTKEKQPEIDYNLNNAWFKFVQLNQLTIDKYGFKYNADGSQPLNPKPELTKIIKFDDVGVSGMKLLKSGLDKFDGIEFNLYTNGIGADEFRNFVNTDPTKYQIPVPLQKDVKNSWDIWLDKDLLTFKLNYVLQTFVFNQQEAFSYPAINAVIGNPNVANTLQNKQQKRNYEKIQNNFYALTEVEKKFAQDYIKVIVNNNSSSNINADVIDKVTKPDHFIKSDDLNMIYNRFVAEKGDVNLFSGHLINQITPGTGGNWKDFFPKYNSEFNKKFKEKFNTPESTETPKEADKSKEAEKPATDANKPNDNAAQKPATNENKPVANQPNDPAKPATAEANKPDEAAAKPAEDKTKTPVSSIAVNNVVPIRPLDEKGKIILSDQDKKDKKEEDFLVDENKVRISVNQTLNRGLTSAKLFNDLTKYSVRHLNLAQKLLIRNNNNEFKLVNVWPDGVYSNEPLSVALQANQMSFTTPLAGSATNPLSKINDWLWYLIAILIFILLVGIIVSVLYRVPGFFGFLYWVSGLSASAATFFGLNLSLSTESLSGFIAIGLISLLVLIYSLNQFVFQVKSGNSLRQASSIALKRNTIFAADMTLMVFIIGIVFAFLGNLELNGFGLSLSIGAFILFLVFVIYNLLTNWLLVDLNNHQANLFLWKKDHAYLKSITGELNINSKIAQKVISKKSLKGNKAEKELQVNFFNWRFLILLALVLVVFIIGITIIFIPSIGFGSSFILKNGYTIDYTIDEQLINPSMSLSQVETALSQQKIEEILKISLVRDVLANNPNVFAFKTIQSFDQQQLIDYLNQYLLPNSFSIQQTTSFSSQLTINNQFAMFATSLGITSVYYAVRFHFFNLLQLWISTFLVLGFSLAVIAIIRINVTRDIINFLFIIFTITFATNIWFISNLRASWNKKNFYNYKELQKIVNDTLKQNAKVFGLFVIIYLLLQIIGAGFNWLQLQNAFIYGIIGIFAVILIVFLINSILWTLATLLRQLIFYKKEANQQDKLVVKYKLRNLDPIDEQLILNINYFE